jgi:hypothetical protein
MFADYREDRQKNRAKDELTTNIHNRAQPKGESRERAAFLRGADGG